jgi:hypothetical protein
MNFKKMIFLSLCFLCNQYVLAKKPQPQVGFLPVRLDSDSVTRMDNLDELTPQTYGALFTLEENGEKKFLTDPKGQGLITTLGQYLSNTYVETAMLRILVRTTPRLLMLLPGIKHMTNFEIPLKLIGDAVSASNHTDSFSSPFDYFGWTFLETGMLLLPNYMIADANLDVEKLLRQINEEKAKFSKDLKKIEALEAQYKTSLASSYPPEADVLKHLVFAVSVTLPALANLGSKFSKFRENPDVVVPLSDGAIRRLVNASKAYNLGNLSIAQ